MSGSKHLLSIGVVAAVVLLLLSSPVTNEPQDCYMNWPLSSWFRLIWLALRGSWCYIDAFLA